MNYYEELGIRADADEEEIRKAHRRLVKLMHPDQHRDQGLKQLAETQMRRLNSIVSTLLDPEERQEYDEQLRGSEALSAAPRQSSWRAVPWWIASTLGAIVLTVAAVWFFADRWGSSFSRQNPPRVDIAAADNDKPDAPVVTPTADPPKSAPPVELPKETTVVPVPSPTPPVVIEKPKTEEVKDVKPIIPPTKATPPPQKVVVTQQQPPQEQVVKKFNKEVPVPTATVPNHDQNLVAGLRPPAAGTSTPTPGGDYYTPPRDNPPPPPAPVVVDGHHSRDPLEGEWVYAPTEPEKPKKGLYPPEFIQLKLKKDTAGMRGEYSARYNVADNSVKVSPDVNFVLKAVDDKAVKYVWTAANGAHGTLTILSVEMDSMRLEWRETSKHNGSFTSGVATLVRRN